MKSILITSSILILVAAALRAVLRGRSKPLAQYALWLVVAVRLLVPWEAAPSAYSALALLERSEEQTHLAETIGQFSIPSQSYRSAWNQALSEFEQSGSIPSVVNTYEDLDAYERVEYRAHALMEGPTLSELAAKYARPVWLGGMAVMGLWFLLVNLRLRRKLRRALPVEADCPLPVYVTPELPSPCLCGLLRPAVYVTPAALADPDRLRHVLTHELTHFRHGDHLWALVRCLCLCVYWFDPLVWWAAAMSRQDCELACDAGAIRRLGEMERIPYGRTLVSMIAEGHNPLLQTATTMTGGKRRVKERVELIARRPKTVAALVLTAALILGLTVGFTFTGVPEESGTGTLGNLRERLMSVPPYLQGDVLTRTTDQSDDALLASYWMDRDWTDLDGSGLGWLLSVRQLSQAEFEEHIGRDNSGWECIARSGDTYYAIVYATDVRFYTLDDAEPFHNAFDAIRTYAMDQVLTTDGVEPVDPASYLMRTPNDGVVQTVADQLMAAPSVNLRLSTRELVYSPWTDNATVGHTYAYSTATADPWDSYYLKNMADAFSWEEFDWGTTEDPRFPQPPKDGAQLYIELPDYSVRIGVWENSDLAYFHDGSGSSWYHAQYAHAGDGPSLFTYLRWWFDEVELYDLRATSVPDRGQSHQEIVEEWIEGFEGAYLKCAPGSQYACTYVRPENVQADCHSWMEKTAMDEFARSRDHVGDDYGKTWFTFSYELVFVPENDSAYVQLLAGNTCDYAELYPDGGAPEGAQIYMRVAYMRLIDGNWVCDGTGTGW